METQPTPYFASSIDTAFLTFVQTYDSHFFKLDPDAHQRFKQFLIYADDLLQPSNRPHLDGQSYTNYFIYDEFETQSLLPQFEAKDTLPCTLRTSTFCHYVLVRSTLSPPITIASKRKKITPLSKHPSTIQVFDLCL